MSRRAIPPDIAALERGVASLRAWDAGWPKKPKAWPKPETKKK
jgi:hypothetical protein